VSARLRHTGVVVEWATHPDDPGPEPPAWHEQEWCDGGTCEHPACLADLELEARMTGLDDDDDEWWQA
jgi:hypothetical protein